MWPEVHPDRWVKKAAQELPPHRSIMVYGKIGAGKSNLVNTLILSTDSPSSDSPLKPLSSSHNGIDAESALTPAPKSLHRRSFPHKLRVAGKTQPASLTRSSQGDLDIKVQPLSDTGQQLAKTLLKFNKEMADYVKLYTIPPCEPANVTLPEFTQACQQFGNVNVSAKKCYVTGKGLVTFPELKCYATGKSLEVAELGERASDQKGKGCSTPMETLICELVSESTVGKIDSSMKKSDGNSKYEISYQATSRGIRSLKLHIQVKGEHIKGSPFAVIKQPPDKITPVWNPQAQGSIFLDWHITKRDLLPCTSDMADAYSSFPTTVLVASGLCLAYFLASHPGFWPWSRAI